MRVLFVTSPDDDYVSVVLWNGLNALLGPGRVRDAVGVASLHRPKGYDGEAPDAYRAMGWCAGTQDTVLRPDESGFDVLVVVAAYLLRGGSWAQVERWRTRLLRPGGRAVYVDGFDAVAGPLLPPPGSFDALFFREMAAPGDAGAHPLLMAAPEEWYDWEEAGERHIDVLFSGNYTASDVRWQVASRIFMTETRHRSLVATAGFIPALQFRPFLRRTKLAVCPPGGGSDCLRTWEAVSSGAIPVFVGHPPRVREPWFTEREMFWCDSAAELPGVLDRALRAADLGAMRQCLLETGRREHTTRARAERLLRLSGFTEADYGRL